MQRFLKQLNFVPILMVFIFFATFSLQANQTLTQSYSLLKLQNLPQNDVNCIFQDSKGFVWIGTLDGLHRFDGYSYKSYYTNNSSNSISSNMIITIDEDSKGNIWIGTYGQGFSKLDPVTDKFTNYNSETDDRFDILNDNVIAMIVDDEDNLWMANWLGVTRMYLNESMDSITEITTIPSDTFSKQLIFNERVKDVFQDKDGEIWIGTNYQVIRVINPYSESLDFNFDKFICKAHRICQYEDGLLVGGNYIVTIRKNIYNSYQLDTLINLPSYQLIYHNQKIWSSYRNGITCLEYTPTEGWSVDYQINKGNSGDGFSSNIVTAMLLDEIGQIWVGSRAGGMSIIDLRAKRFKHYEHSSLPGSISSNFVQSIFEDHYHNLWIGTEDGGVNFLKKQDGNDYSHGFEHIVVNSDKNENRAYCIEEVMTPNSKLHESVVFVGTSHNTHLVTIDAITLKKKKLPSFITGIGFVFALENQGDSVLWAGTYGGGLWKMSLDDDANIISNKHYTPENNSESTISSNIIRDILLDKDNNLWIATDNGLNRIVASELHKTNPKFEVFEKGTSPQKLSFDYILKLMQASDGTIWMGTMGGGLISYAHNLTNNSYEFNTISVKDGLPNNSVKSILEDDKGILWLATNKGLCRYNPANGDAVNYNVDDGLQHNEFSELCAFKRANGEFLFGGINGFNTFFPNQIYKDTITPKLFFTDFFILNKLVYPGEEINGRVVLDKSIEYTKEIELKHNQNSFSIGFLGLHYEAPQKSRYKYILEGFDEEWYSSTAIHRIAKYTNVPAGKYTFKVIGSNSDNVWTEDPITIDINIRPHFTRTKLAYFIYFILIALANYIAVNLLQGISSRKKKLFLAEMERDKSENLSQMKLRFFTNISHEFRTPLTLITTPIEKLINKDKELNSEQRLHNYKLIKQNVNVMLRLINQLMDFRRVDQDKMKLVPDENGLNQFLRTIGSSFDGWAENKNISFEFKALDKDVVIWYDKDKLEKIVYNLLSNAFKFTPDGGKIILSVVEEEEQVSISVSDTGAGIKPEEQEQIFERYYQSDQKNKEHVGGTGIGLALTKSLVDLHKGTIKLSSSEEGSVFTVYLNKGHNWLSDNANLIDINESVSIVAADLNANFDSDSENIPIDDSELTKGELVKNNYKILIVEDNAELRSVVSDIFSDEFTIIEAGDGKEGFDLCLEHLPDLVISDIMMPIMNGVELCHKIKNEEVVSHIPVLLLTAKNTVEAQIEGYETGADGYVPKPFNAELLRIRAVSLVLNREKLRKKFQKEIEINPMVIANSPVDLKFLEQILGIIEENLSDADFTIEKLSEKYGVSRIYLNRKIKSLTGETANLFLRNVRLKHAAELLRQNVLTVSEVTWQVGYNDLRTFRTRFKEKFGVSPSEYAKKNAKPDAE